jgi:hypothetical protein
MLHSSDSKRWFKIHNSWDGALQIPDLINIIEAKIQDRYGLCKPFLKTFLSGFNQK